MQANNTFQLSFPFANLTKLMFFRMWVHEADCSLLPQLSPASPPSAPGFTVLPPLHCHPSCLLYEALLKCLLLLNCSSAWTVSRSGSGLVQREQQEHRVRRRGWGRERRRRRDGRNKAACFMAII